MIAVACSLERKDFRMLKSTKERMLKIAASNLHVQDEWGVHDGGCEAFK